MKNKEVLVDVYPWAMACEKAGGFAMEGIFRHAEYLCRHYTPVLVGVSTEYLPAEGVRILNERLRKTVQVLHADTWDALGANVDRLGRVWVSLALDFFCPILPHLKTTHRLAIVHDMLALNGEFGARKVEQAANGLLHNDAFAYVSVATLAELTKNTHLMKRRVNYVRYSCFHTHEKLPEISGMRALGTALSVHSIFARKNLPLEAKFTRLLSYRHFHVGRMFEELSYADWTSVFQTDTFHWLGAISDDKLESMYRTAGLFISLSSREGFNIPPMEAILYGVPKIVLSDIPIHREIYRDVKGIAYYDLNKAPEENQSLIPLGITEQAREMLFETYRAETVTKEFHEFVASVAA